MPQSLSVLVTGATGKQGGSVARVLLEKGHRVRALTRKPDSQGAQALQQLGAELAIGNFDEPDSLVRAHSEDIARMFEWFEKVGYSADIAALRRDFPEVGWRSFEAWASVQDWKALLGA